VRKCTKDEGGPSGSSNQVLISSHRKTLRFKSRGGERCRKRRERIFRQVTVERGERKRTSRRSVESRFRRCQNRGMTPSSGMSSGDA